MSSIFGGLEKMATQTTETAIGFGLGVALANALAPLGTQLRQEAYSLDPSVAPDAAAMAAGFATGKVAEGKAREWAKAHGIGDEQFDALVDVARGGPGIAVAFELWRRGQIDEGGFRRAARRQGLEGEWIEALVHVKENLLGPEDLARGIHRGLVADPGLLQGTLPSGVGKVPAYPVYPIDALHEAAAHGYDRDRLGVLVGLQGNPMGPHEAAEALFRGVLTENDFLRAIAEGNTRNEWADAIREQTRQIPTARDYIENALRGYRTLPDALSGAAKHGMSADDATMIYQNQGRPMAIHQITTALARGGKFKPEQGEIHDPYMASVVEGNLKPAYYELAIANRYSYPSPSFMRLLVHSGELHEHDFAQYGKEQGWPPALADQIAKAVSAGTAGTAKRLTADQWLTEYAGGYLTRTELLTKLKALGYSGAEAEAYAELGDARRTTASRNARLGRIHARYVGHFLTEPDMLKALAALGLPQEAHDRIVADWNAEREVNATLLTQSQIVKAFKLGVWTRDETAAALVERGMSAADAGTLLDEQ